MDDHTNLVGFADTNPSKISSIDLSDTYKTIFDSIDDGIMVLGKDGVIVEVNAKLCEILGQEQQVLLGKHLRDLLPFFPEGSLNNIMRNLGLSKMGMKVPTVELELNFGHDRPRQIEMSAVSLIKGDQFEGDIVILRDITLKKGMEAAVEQSEKRIRTVLDSVKEGITLSDDQGHFLIFNPEMEKLTGYSSHDANSAEEFAQLIHPGQAHQVISSLGDFASGQKITGETTLRTKDGSVKHVIVSTTVIIQQDKKLYLSAYHDVTAMKEAEAELMMRNRSLEQTTIELNQTTKALEQARDHLEETVAEKTKELTKKVREVEDLAQFPKEDPFPVMRVFSDGTLLYANQASEALLTLWGCQVGTRLPSDWHSLVTQVFETNNRKIVEVEISGQYVSFVLVPIRSGGYVNLYGRDVTREKEVDRMKNEFISMVSHQIRTPLTSIRWYSEMLLKSKNPLDEGQAETAQIIHETAVSLASLVNDLLSISRMESGRIDSQPIRANLIDLVNTVVKELKGQAQQKEITLNVNAPEISEFLFDPKLVREVYINLIGNAIKYTKPTGQVWVNIAVDEASQIVTTQVKDTGIGIPPEAQADIFKRFYRAQNAVDSQAEGTGLGLSVAQMMVEKCGGKIWFESEIGSGTSFFFTLPVSLS